MKESRMRHGVPAQWCGSRSVCRRASLLRAHSRIPTQTVPGAMREGVAVRPDAEHRSRAHGPGVEERTQPRPRSSSTPGFPEYTGNDMADPALTDRRSRAARSRPRACSSTRRCATSSTASIPSSGSGPNRIADDSFQRLTYGGYLMRQGLSQSVPTRIVANRTMERQLLFDIGHPDAFENTGKFHTALLDEADFALNRAAFAENGYSKGMFYNTYCNARVTLSDGRVYVFGGHDMQSNNGLYKVNIFDPETETWVARARAVHAIELGRAIPSASSCSPATRTRSTTTAAISGTSRARSPRSRRTRSTPAGIRRRCRCRTTRCSWSAASTRTTPLRRIPTASRRAGRT